MSFEESKMIVRWVCVLTLGIASFVAPNLVASRSAAAEPEKVSVFVNGDGYKLYRIPSLICTPKGTLLAFCEGRSDNDQSPTDMVLKRSLDGGKTWLSMQVLVKAVPESAMDPTAVIDHITEEIVLLYDRWPEIPKGEKLGEHQRAPGLGRDSITTWIMTSKDEGVTWSTPVDITAMTKQAEWTETGHGPGLGIQTRSGRLIIPCFETKPVGGKWGTSWNFIIYSDDHGKTWQMSDNEVGPNVNESQVVELADGALWLNMRTGHGKGIRAGATSKDDGKTWSNLYDIPELPDAGCQASLIRYTWPDQDGSKSRILYSKGATPDRRVGTIRVSYDEAKTWPVSKVVCKEYFGYSCLTVMPDSTIGCLFETAGCSKIAFTNFSLEWLTDGEDSLKR
jgi:sialidase-1